MKETREPQMRKDMTSIVQHMSKLLLHTTAKHCKSLAMFWDPALTFLQVADGLVVVLQLQVTLAQEEVGLHWLAVQLQRVLTICQSLVMLLQLHMAESPVGVVHCHRWVTVLGDGTDQTVHMYNNVMAHSEGNPSFTFSLWRATLCCKVFC